MAAKPLKELLDRADELIGSSASASQEKLAASSEVDTLATLLSSATEDLALEQGSSESSPAEIEKAAMAMNRVNTALCLDAIVKVDRFEEKAAAEGYDESQIQEALSKTAAKKMLDKLPLLVAMADLPSPDLNVMPTKVIKKSLDQKLGRLSITKSLGY